MQLAPAVSPSSSSRRHPSSSDAVVVTTSDESRVTAELLFRQFVDCTTPRRRDSATPVNPRSSTNVAKTTTVTQELPVAGSVPSGV
jgi:hypothetical protein